MKYMTYAAVRILSHYLSCHIIAFIYWKIGTRHQIYVLNIAHINCNDFLSIFNQIKLF